MTSFSRSVPTRLALDKPPQSQNPSAIEGFVHWPVTEVDGAIGEEAVMVPAPAGPMFDKIATLGTLWTMCALETSAIRVQTRTMTARAENSVQHMATARKILKPEEGPRIYVGKSAGRVLTRT